MLPYKRALVTGGAGFIGSHLVDALLENGISVHVLDNLSTGRMENLRDARRYITFFEGDLRDERTVSKACSGCEVVFHQAAMVSVPKTIENPLESAMINDIGTLTVFGCCKNNRVKRIIYASSSAVYGDDPRIPLKEDTPPSPISPYAVQKLTNEYYGKTFSLLYGLESVGLRYFNVFGPRQDPSSPYSGVISIFMSKSLQNMAPTIYGDGNQTRDFIFVKDVVRSNLAASIVEGVSGKVFNVATGRQISILELWNTICNVSGCKLTPLYSFERKGDILHSAGNVHMMKTCLGVEPQFSFEDAVKTTYEWYFDTQHSRRESRPLTGGE
jgi:UDP-glucose 4-epimerase